MADVPSSLIAAYVVAALCIVWLASANLVALARYKTGLDSKKPSFASRAAWAISLVAVLTGPLVVVAAALAIGIGLREKRRAERGEIPRRSRLCADIAMKNGAVLLVSALLVGLFVWLTWR